MFDVGGTWSTRFYSMHMKSQLSWTHPIDSRVEVHILVWMLLLTLFPQSLTPATSSGPISRLTTSQTCCFKTSTRDNEFSNRDSIETLLALRILCAVSEGQQVMMSCLNQGTLDTFAKTWRQGTYQNKSHIIAKNFKANTCQAVSTWDASVYSVAL
jgi:hypothetical protein